MSAPARPGAAACSTPPTNDLIHLKKGQLILSHNVREGERGPTDSSWGHLEAVDFWGSGGKEAEGGGRECRG